MPLIKSSADWTNCQQRQYRRHFI